MKLALDPSMYRDDLTLEEMVYKTAELGYEYIELSPREDFCPFYKYPKVDSAKIKQLKRLLRDTGVKLSSLLPLYHWAGPEEDRRQAAVRNWKRAIEIAVELEVDLMNSEFSGSKYDPYVCEEKFIKSMDELLPVFEKEGIKLNLQAHPYDFIETHKGAMDMIRALDRDWINLVYSTAHTFFYDDGKGDIETMFDEAGDRLTHVLFADTFNHKAAHGLRYIVNPPDAKVTVHQHLDIGQGEVDFDTIFRKLREMKFDGIATNAVFAWVDEKADESSRLMLRKMKEELGLA
ncbi:sugar phosphate isomerase/epimerase family protein [Bacillus atrophaeus]|uniref:Sugar-phosphate epimerase/isomerase n=1 Tax=Bacillus atrophaeus (strain 1942) TaxID=720555 RepID=A0ABM5M2Y4_BACA1|nr:sugar phosphate isomerase/epimerase [Bacillus atrophaeus]AMR64618.1 protein iolH [Bacillus subtilis subsp. globigii]ADP34488.1 putative sugar-phosphate epimerase/isomerase [Bacillus atrophaeus 1942]AIK47433.1 xylose isomerase-like TIM barrel family protein [Bacillus atrophaeus subsp. globigii]EIM11470.1 putative sugar-phosphate epimerase/isomerase [Bacillus atrophaeus C89]KFK81476.1 xylose isomerase-like TIM barrel family protein [Bacillus atrophaeus]